MAFIVFRNIIIGLFVAVSVVVIKVVVLVFFTVDILVVAFGSKRCLNITIFLLLLYCVLQIFSSTAGIVVESVLETV